MKHFARSTLIIAVFFGLEKVLGFVRQVAVSRIFGRSPELDAFNAANNIPDMLFTLISGGALAMALIPVLSEYLETKGREQAWDVFSRIANLVFFVTAGLSVLVAIFADRLIQWNIGIAPGFGPEQQNLVAELMQINLFATLFFSMAGLIIAGLQANQHFLLPAMAPSMYDLGTLIGVVIFVPEKGLQIAGVTLPALGLGIHGLVYGTVLGAFLFFSIQIPGLIRYRFRWSPQINLKHPGVQKVLIVLGPRVVTMFFIQSIFIAQDNLASRLIAGSVTALVYGWLFMQVPESLIGTAIGTALLPTISEQAARGDHTTLQITLNTTVRVILAFTIPITLLLFFGIGPIVGILGFDEIGTELVIWCSRAYMLGLFSYSLIEVTARAFYAQQNAKTPLITIMVTASIFVLLAIPLSRWLGAPGIALANSTAFSIQLGLMIWLLKKNYPNFTNIGPTLQRVIPVSLGAGALVWGLNTLIPWQAFSTLIQAALGLGILGLGGLIVLPFIWPEIKLLQNIE